VHPKSQGKGIGKQLLQVAEENLARPMTLKAAMDNPKSFSFYEKYGWHQVSIHEDVDEPVLVQIEMRQKRDERSAPLNSAVATIIPLFCNKKGL